MDEHLLRRTLSRVFGLDEFRPGQEEVIRSILSGRHTLAVMPTGAGKSLCYQLPALLLPGMTLVISPLISLMKDQTDKLRQLGLEASQVNSAQNAGELEGALQAIEAERPEFVMTTPERATQAEFLQTLQGKTLDLIVIDEAHCISEWGHDFRPSYLGLGRVIDTLGSPPVLALTATATPSVIDDIRASLDLPDLQIINTGLYRPNLDYEVLHVSDDDDRQQQLIRLLRALDRPGIVYTATIRNVELVTRLLTGAGFNVARYHGQLSARERHGTQERFMNGTLDAMVATNAFGLGIDKADVRFVAHYNMPGSVQAYYQESGRAGRDGATARCTLLYHPADRRTHIFFTARKYPHFEHVVAVYRALDSAAAEDAGLDLTRIHAVSGVSRGKVQVVLALLVDQDVVGEADGRYRVLERNLNDARVQELARRYQARHAHDREKLDRMVAYAQSARCRWTLLLEAFDDLTEWTSCRHCDNCRRHAERQANAVAQSTRVP